MTTDETEPVEAPVGEPSSNEYREQRIANMRALEARGYLPFGAAFTCTAPLAELRATFEEGREVSAAGRLMTIRDMGKSIFADLRDHSDRFQLYIQKQVLGDAAFEAFQLLDLGDHVGVTGTLFTTRTGELSLKVASWTLLAKALLPPPEKWHGLQDVEARYRQRYLDLMTHPEVKETFRKRAQMVAGVRSFLMERGFMEVETPMIQTQAGGAAAKPFKTHYGALGQDMFLRIAPELYLKRLLVGGMDRVFELNRSFRNEGISRTHNPEFTMLEIYQAYSDARGMQELIQSMVLRLADTIYGKRLVGTEAIPIDLTPPWRTVTYHELIRARMGEDWFGLDLATARARAEAAGLSLDPAWDMLLVSHEVYEKLIERTLIQPTFVTRLPAALIPLAKSCPDDASLADVFELVIGGTEIAPGYTELNDPLAQRERLAAQAGEDAEKLDEDFIVALEHGMPPAGGMGVGIDRLCMLLTGAESLRDVILFPQLRSRQTPS